jgi:hypothetical protein
LQIGALSAARRHDDRKVVAMFEFNLMSSLTEKSAAAFYENICLCIPPFEPDCPMAPAWLR